MRDSEFQDLISTLYRFCPFEAMGAVNAELKHANLLSYFMDPLRPHGFGDSILRSILTSILINSQDQINLTPLDIHLMDMDGVSIKREENNIDILVVIPEGKCIFCFELKVGAAESDGQLKKYKEIVQKKWPSEEKGPWKHMFVFLRPYEEVATDKEWLNVDFTALVDGLQKIAYGTDGDEEARFMLKKYLEMIQRNFIMENKLQEIAASLWSKHEEVLNFLADNKPDEVSDIFTEIIKGGEAFCEDVSIPGVTLVSDYHSGTRLLRFAIKEVDDLEGMKTVTYWTPSKRILLVEIAGEKKDQSSNLIIKGRLVLGPAPEAKRQEWFDRMINHKKGKRSAPSQRHTRMLSEVICEIENSKNADEKIIIIKTKIKEFLPKLKPFVDALLTEK